VLVRIDEGLSLPRDAIRFPIELRKPAGMEVADPATWPTVEGRLEVVGGRLLYMPPCADVQQDTVADVAFVLRSWSELHSGFVAGTNEAGMKLGDEVRGADAAVWRADDLGPRDGRFRRTPPILAVEVAGQDEDEAFLRAKAAWYLDHGVAAVWMVLPAPREVVVIDAAGEARFGVADRIPERQELAGLTPEVRKLFAQIMR
jgi:Uma2 family endonuclease